MTDHPSTFDAESTGPAVDWDDHATIHLADDGQGVFDGLKGLYRGTLAEMVGMIANMPAGERAQYVIQKAGDHRLDAGEITWGRTEQGGQVLALTMLCSRTYPLPEGAPDRDAVANVLRSERLEDYSDAIVADLRASATIVGE